MIDFINLEGLRIIGYQQDEVLNKPLHKILKFQEHSHILELLNVNQGAEIGGEPSHQTLVQKNGKLCQVEVSSSAYIGIDNEIEGSIILLRDVTERESLLRDREWRASHDSLTGAINRTSAEQIIKEQLSLCGNKNKSCAFVFLDLDGFKIINDSFGHEAGDFVLKGVVKKMLSTIRQNDILARFGGDEFLLVLVDTSLYEALQIASKLIETIKSASFEYASHRFTVGLSAGIDTVTNGNIKALEEILNNADSAMYKAKLQGGNVAVIFDENDEDISLASQSKNMLYRLKSSLNGGDGLRCAKQKIVHGNTHKLAGYEYLMRFEDEHGNITPTQAFKIAERYGLAYQLDLKVIEVAFQEVMANGENKVPQFNSLNLSGLTFNNPKLIDDILALSDRYNINLSDFIFEITESASISNLKFVNDFIVRVHKLGAKVYLDDFGSGLSSFEYLKNISVDGIKIDGQFIKNITKSRTDQLIVESITTICKQMNIKVVAEFVESEEIVAVLGDLDIDFYQGYFFGKPHNIQI